MRKLFLLGTMLGVATTALAFGGMFNHGSKSTAYKGGVDAIGVHVNGKGKADIDIRSCDSETEELVGSECCLKTLIYTDNDTTKCCSTEGYAVQDGKCKKQCGLGWTLNEETNDCECPDERRCGDVCCGETSVCHPELNVCCHYDYEYMGAEFMDYCCPAGSTGYRGDGNCCDNNSVQYRRGDEDLACCPAGHTLTALKEHHHGFSHSICCEAGKVGYCSYREDDYSEYDEDYCDEGDCCAPDKISYGTGENGADICEE